MGYCLNVPFVTQLGIGSHVKGVNPIDDPTGCWYASACMVGYSFEAGPRLGVPELYTLPLKQNAKGKVLQYGHYVINTAWMPTLKAREQLVDVDEPTNQEWTAKALIDELKKYGPIFFGWLKTHNGQTYGHASVIVGVKNPGAKNPQVIIHDPENRPFFEIDLQELNQKIIWGVGFTLRRAGNAYQHNISTK
ncbi:papain-like cysteine protease family protein [Methylomarinum sp. Ch1-1]|uniref:Papain-like cysteine protease family protein n=1 Tax=Methylomarinum roseum TaxID=3067653 RepID=A0AAU7NX60_9GAMM